MTDADKVLALRSEAERLTADVARLEALQEAGQKELDGLRQQLVDLGFDPAGDLNAQLEERAAQVHDALSASRRDLADLRREAGES